jgi:HEAT repeat protein
MYHLTLPLPKIQQCETAILPDPAKEATHMPMTLEQLRNQLSAIEPDDGIHAGIGPSEIPILEQLLQDTEAWMASRAVVALSAVPDMRAVTILSRAVTDPRPEVRVAVAASVSNLRPGDANNILLNLLADTDLGVRKFAVQAVSGTHDTAVHTKLRELEIRDPAPPIRDAAKDRLRELKLTRP